MSVFRSHDLDEVRSYVGKVFKPHALTTHGPAAGLDAFVRHRRVGDGAIVHFGYGPVTATVDPGPLERFYLLQFARAGSGVMHYGARRVLLAPNAGAACLSPQRPIRAQFDATEMLVARIDKAQLVEHYVRHLGERPDEPLEFDPEIRLDAAAGAQLAAAVDLLDRSADGPDALRLQQLLYTTLIYVQPNTWRARLLHTPAQRGDGCVSVARDYVDANLGDDLSVETLSAAANVRPRTLFDAFARSLGVTPMTYVRNVRLERARRELAQGDTGVTGVASRLGFTHLGRFAAQYREAFGETPSATRRRVR